MTAAVEPDEEERWRPDDLLIPAILDPRNCTVMADLSVADQAWVVAGLKRLGYTAEFTAERLECSVRSVRSIMAGAGVIVMLYLDEADNFGDTYRMSEAELRRLSRELADATSARDRYKVQLDRLLDAHLTEGAVSTFPCGCPRTKYNTYIAPKTGKAGCREHRRLAVQRCRERKRTRPIQGSTSSDDLEGTQPAMCASH